MSRFNSFDLHSIKKVLDLFDNDGLQVDGKVFIDNVGELTVEYDGIEDRHYMTHFTSAE